jgi:hypothetical protein
MGRRVLPPAPVRFVVPVVGVTFAPGYPDTFHRINDLWVMRVLDGEQEPLPAVLIRQPDNPDDPYAIAVGVPAAGAEPVGHLPRAVAMRLAPVIDAGVIYQAAVVTVRIVAEHIERPGMDLSVWRVEENQ